MKEIVYQHNDRGYFNIYNKLIAKYPNKPTWLFKEFGALIDFVSSLINNIALDILQPETRESAYAFADRCGYVPIEKQGTECDLTITLTGAMIKTITVGTQFGGISSTTGLYVYFEVTADAISGGTDTITAHVKQKRTYTDEIIHVTENPDEWYEISIGDEYIGILSDSISLKINSLTWDKVENLDASISTDRHFVLVYKSDGKTMILFGDGIYGMIPPSGHNVFATFSTCNGTSGEMEIGEIIDNIANDVDILSVTNISETSGGSDEESIPSIIRNSRISIRSKNIIWSIEDLEYQARQGSTQVIKAHGISGAGQASLHIVPSGGGVPSAPLKTSVQSFCEAKTQFGLMPITMFDPTYININITADISVITGFVPATVQDLVEFAMTLATSSFDNEITEYYDQYGISKTRTGKINIIWAWAFTEQEEEALDYIINKWKSLLGSRDMREWGQDGEVGMLWQFGDSLESYGVDLFDLTSPVANTAVGIDEIAQTGTVVITVV